MRCTVCEISERDNWWNLFTLGVKLLVCLDFFGIIGILDGEGYYFWIWRMAYRGLRFHLLSLFTSPCSSYSGFFASSLTHQAHYYLRRFSLWCLWILFGMLFPQMFPGLGCSWIDFFGEPAPSPHPSPHLKEHYTLLLHSPFMILFFSFFLSVMEMLRLYLFPCLSFPLEYRPQDCKKLSSSASRTGFINLSIIDIFGRENSLLWEVALCTIECLAASLFSTS